MKNIKITRLLSLLISFMMLATAFPQKALAVDIDFYSSNDILFYNPDTCGAAADSSGGDTVTKADKYGGGPATAGSGHDWKLAKNATDFGGPGDNPDEGTAYSNETFGQLTSKGVFYFAVYPHKNKNTPKEINDAWDSGKLKGKGKLIFKGKNGKTAIGSLLDAGPGNEKNGTWLDLGHPLAVYLGVSTETTASMGDVHWDFVNEGGSSDTGTDSSSSDANYEKRLETTLKFLTGKGLSLAAAAGIAGNLKNESGIEPAKIQGQYNSLAPDNYQPKNGVGFGIAQWTFTSRQSKLVAFAKSQGKKITDLEMQLEFLWKEATGDGYSKMMSKLNSVKSDTPYNTVEAPVAAAILFHGRTTKIMSNPTVKKVNPPRGFEGSADSGDRVVNKRGGDAKKIYDKYKGKIADGTGVGGVDTDAGGEEGVSVDCGSSISTGDVVATALSFALDRPIPPDANPLMNKESDAKPAFVAAIKQYNPGASVADCGMFVATVMIASGADTKYPKAGTSNQLSYVKENTDKYKIIEEPQRNDLSSGDILIVNNGSAHHTMIYTGNDPYPAVDASQDERVPSVRTADSLEWLLRQNGVIAARLIR